MYEMIILYICRRYVTIIQPVAEAPVHAYIPSNTPYVQMVRRSIYKTRPPKHSHSPILPYKNSPGNPLYGPVTWNYLSNKTHVSRDDYWPITSNCKIPIYITHRRDRLALQLDIIMKKWSWGDLCKANFYLYLFYIFFPRVCWVYSKTIPIYCRFNGLMAPVCN